MTVNIAAKGQGIAAHPADCYRVQIEAQFVARSLALRDEAQRRAEYIASDAVMRRLERMLADAKSRTLA
jgi:ribosome-associated translation inhibitor RaiA